MLYTIIGKTLKKTKKYHEILLLDINLIDCVVRINNKNIHCLFDDLVLDGYQVITCGQNNGDVSFNIYRASDATKYILSDTGTLNDDSIFFGKKSKKYCYADEKIQKKTIITIRYFNIGRHNGLNYDAVYIVDVHSDTYLYVLEFFNISTMIYMAYLTIIVFVNFMFL